MRVLLIILIIAFSHSALAQISKTEFSQVILILREEFSPLSTANNRKLKFFTSYDTDWAQAFARRWDDDEIHVYGGFAKIKGATQDSFALIVCHELGHLHAGYPYSNVDLELSVEGKSDYWATNVCLPKVLHRLKEITPTNHSRYCSDYTCNRILDAAMVVTTHFARNDKDKPSLDKRDESVVTEVMKSHPSAQCRLDTLKAGFFYEPAPKCWMP